MNTSMMWINIHHKKLAISVCAVRVFKIYLLSNKEVKKIKEVSNHKIQGLAHRRHLVVFSLN